MVLAPWILLALAAGALLGAALGGRLPGRGPAPAHEPGAPPRLLAGAATGIALFRDRRILWANARFAEILGTAPGTLQGSESRLLHPDAAAYEHFGQTALAACLRGEAFRGEFRLRRVDGSPFWAHLAGDLVDPADPEAGTLWFMEDITERMEAQLDLAEVLSLNQKLIAASPSAILLYRAADGACMLANEAAARLVGAPQEDLLAQNFRRIRTWRTAGLLEAAERTLASGLEQALECHLHSSFGRDVWMSAQFVPFVSRGERLLLLLANDVSERVKATSALRASEEKYRVVVEGLSEGLALLDTDGCFTFCNASLMEMGGLKAEEILGKHYSTFVHESHLAGLQARRILERPVAAETFEVGLRRRDGGLVEARISVSSVLDVQGAPVALAILATDISVRKRAERDRERAAGELRQKNQELETLLYVASHDLRSPLVNIQGFSQRLARSLEEIRRAQAAAGSLEAFTTAIAPHLMERMPASLEFIRASGARMDAIINGLLTLSRAGRMVLRAEDLDMDAVLESCSANLAFQLQSVDGVLEVGDLPRCRADAAQVTQIISNLLDNAIKYRHPDRPLRVRVSGQASGPVCEYVVEDNGVGIAPEHRERIWEIFQRLDPQGPIQGDGLGLTLVRRMAERNGGRIWVDAAPENGCRFHLELPVLSS